MRKLLLVAPLALAPLFVPAARADEGMWLYNNFPSGDVKAKYGFSPDQAWLDHLRLSSAGLGGCSASFVSPNGLVMTNHHCAHSCIEQLSTAKKDFVKEGFYATAPEQEVKCPEIEVKQLTDISDVTERVTGATKGVAGQAFSDALKAEMSKIEKACATGDDVRCDVVTLYNGGKYNLYKYRRYQDARLVFAPEFAIAFFGGDPDNFNFPRYDLDVSFVRVYDKTGKPAKTEHFKWATAPVKDGDLTFVTGNPGRTSRLLPISKLELERDLALPKRLLYLSELRGALHEFQNRGPEQHRIANHMLFGVENALKAFIGRHETLVDKAFFASKVADEQKLLQKAKNKAAYAGAWDAIAKAQDDLRKIYSELNYIEGERRGLGETWGFRSELFALAKTLVRAAEELPKPNEKRLREYTDARLPGLKQELFSSAPIYDEFEIFRLAFSLTKLREELGADHAFVKRVLARESPLELATRLVRGTKLKDIAFRRALFQAGRAPVAASNDPMIELARRIDGDARAIRKRYEDTIESVEQKNSELIAKARFEVYGTSTYPDATGTMRVSYGTVKGYPERGHTVSPITRFAGAFERATGQEPFALPQSWIGAKSKLNMDTPFDFASTNDIIGGNSGSAVVNKNAEVIGLVFDGNIQSLGGEYGFDVSVNRTVSVTSAALMEALDKIYGARRIVEEIRGK